MSRIRTNTIVNSAGTGAPNFPKGAIISGISTITADINIGTGASISSPATNELALGTNNTERFLINSVGDIGISKTSVVSFGSAIPTIEIKGRATSGGLTSRSGAICFESGSGTNGYAALWGNEGGIEYYSSPTDRGTVAYGCKFTSGGNLAFASGKGIDFSATSDGSGTMTSELLDDYEVGTFTATISFDAGTTGITYNASRNEGHYTKIGKQIFAYFRVQITSKGTDTGTLRLNTLPYVCADTFSSSSHDGGLYMARSAGVNASNVGASPVGGIVQGGNTYAIFQFRSSNGGSSTMDNTDIDNDFDITGMVQYFTN